jgi:hypothetical protein
LRCDLQDLLEAEAQLKRWSPRGDHLLGDVILLADEQARRRELENVQRREEAQSEVVAEIPPRQSFEQLTVWACGTRKLARSAS